MKGLVCVAVAIVSTFLANVVAQVAAQQASSCDEEMRSFCEVDANRYCFLDSESKPVCGNCLEGFIEWRARCIQDEAVDLDLFLDEYHPIYLTTLTTEERTQLLSESIRFIAGYQNQNPPMPFELGLNALSADSLEDALALRGFNATAPSDASVPILTSTVVELNGTLPFSVDWVEQGLVTTVKDQGRCGGCWANSIAGSIESASAIQSNYLQSLSVQQFVSCDDNNFGCKGGSLVNAMSFSLRSVHGIASATDYPFTDGKGTATTACNTGPVPSVTVSQASYIVNFEDDLTFQERRYRMKVAVAKQPVAMVLKSHCPIFTNYRSGVLTADDGCTCFDPYCGDHAVLMVGYNDSAEIPYWKIKNSWTTGWGEGGYIRIAQAQQGDYGLFGVLTHGVVPDLTFNVTGDSVTEAEPIKPKKEDEPLLEWWAWVLIVLGACLLIFMSVSCFLGLLCPRKK